MFDRTACPDPGLLAAQPYVSIEALAALSALLDLALNDQTPSAVPAFWRAHSAGSAITLASSATSTASSAKQAVEGNLGGFCVCV
jgi:inactivated superfamily I helicase